MTQGMFDREAILNKCRKILAIADSKGATPAEAANAAALLKRMLEKYQLSMPDLEAGLRRDGIVQVRIVFVPRLYGWQKYVHGMLGEAFDCRVLFSKNFCRPPIASPPRWGTWISYVGCASDVTVAEYFAQYFLQALEPSWLAYRKRHGGSLCQRGSFWMGAAQLVARRLVQMRPEVVVPDNGERGLVVVKNGLLRAWFYEQGIKARRKSNRKLSIDHTALRHGQEAGRALPLHEGVTHAK